MSYYGFKLKINVPPSIKDTDEYLDYVLNPMGILSRYVNLNSNWYDTSFCPYIAILDESIIVALIPSQRAYVCISPLEGKEFIVNKYNSERISKTAICLYPPLPNKKLKFKDLLIYIVKFISIFDIIKSIVFSLFILALSFFTPFITYHLFNNIAIQSEYIPLFAIFIYMVCVYFSNTILIIGKELTMKGISTKLDAMLSNSLMMRLLNLSPNFFRKYNSGELHSRFSCSMTIASTIIDFVFTSGLSIFMSILYIGQIKIFSSVLVIPSIITILIYSLLIIIYSLVRKEYRKRTREARTEEIGFLVTMINGIQKIRLSGSEKRIFAKWASKYKERASSEYNLPMVLKQYETFTTLLNLLSFLILYYFVLKAKINVAVYMGFMSSYTMLLSVITSLAGSIAVVSSIGVEFSQLKPILDEVPESTESKRTLKNLSGKIDIKNLSFKYLDSQPFVIDKLSLSIKPGEYIGIVGKSGCGKSTLMRLILGFEKPISGGISFDSIDINAIELRSLRRQIGCVMQDGGIFTDSIKANITISAPTATDEDVWKSLCMAGMDEDVKNMPMGIETLISENTNTISGGQKQRILIARALITNPNILFFDEATSALDNNTQKIVTDTLLSLKCTRIVIAHRLSTVQNCDRIILIDKGNIAEEGTFDELMNKNGKFTELVKRQIK